MGSVRIVVPILPSRHRRGALVTSPVPSVMNLADVDYLIANERIFTESLAGFQLVMTLVEERDSSYQVK